MPPTTKKLGPKGYTLLKNELSAEEIQAIRKALTVRPHTPGAPVQTASSFSVWRENTSKLYVPRYWGEARYGAVTESTVPMGDPISLEFHGALRDYQRPVVEKFLAYVRDDGGSVGGDGNGVSVIGGRGGLLDLYPAWGKTSSALYIASQLGVKTLVVVGKEFLMNQWRERIAQFLPAARVGRIQGPVIDIENKDIVLVMLQSLVSKTKDYSPETFASFGFTIFDEVHHVSSESFSRSLFSLVTRYMLGLSGTMNRKDGTSHVFKWFLGEVVHKAERPQNDMTVQVRKLTYVSGNAQFDETVMDMRGNPQISTMITKICDYTRRTEFILQVLADFIRVSSKGEADGAIGDGDANTVAHETCFECKRPDVFPMRTTCCEGTHVRCIDCWEKYEQVWESNYTITTQINPKTGRKENTRLYPRGRTPRCPCCDRRLTYEQNYVDTGVVKPYTQLQTIILSHNLSILRYMYRAICSRNLASVGYYVGGMKEAALKQSETKHVILATYAMAAEGLDIPSLNAEFLITPRTDVEQAVGRILRAKHSITSPVIVDFVDTHDVFKRQWMKRRRFYRKEGYQIVEATSREYRADIFDGYNRSGSEDKDSDEDSDNDNDNDTESNNGKKAKPIIGKCLLKINPV